MNKEKIKDVLKKLRENAKKRNFVQTVDLVINLKNYDTKKPENRINETVALPHGKGKDSTVVIFSDEIKVGNGVKVLRSDDIAKLADNKREAKRLIKSTDFFVAEPKLMPVIGKSLGQLLGPRGKMPSLITSDADKIVETLKKSVRISVKDSPVVQCPVGREDMADDEIAENVEAVLKFLEKRLPKGKNNISKVFIKLTMSKPIKVEF